MSALPKELLERGADLGINLEQIAGQEPEEVAAFLGDVEKAAADADEGDEPDEDGDEGVVKALIGHLGKAIDALASGRVRKDEAGEAGDNEESDDEEKPESNPEVLALRKELDEQKQELADERTAMRVEKSLGGLTAAVKARRMTPAAAKQLEPVIEHLAASEVEHVEKSADGDVTTPMAELVIKAASHDASILEPMFEAAKVAADADDEPEIWKHLKAKAAAGNGSGQGN